MLEGITDRDIDILIAKKSFWNYCKITHPEHYKDSRPHLKILCDTLQKFYDKELLDKNGEPFTKIMIRLPPQHYKSFTLVKFTQWVLGLNNLERIITASYGDSTATDFSRYTRDGIMEIKNTQEQIVFSDIFPNTSVKKTDASIQRWALNGQHFTYLGVGCGGAVTGKGATIRIIDDLVKDAEQAMSENALEKAWLWLSGTFSSRTSAEGGEVREIFCATLWGEGDPQYVLEETEGDEWYILSMPIYNEEKDEMLCDDIMNKKAFLKLKKRMLIDSRTKMIFYANYMCEAIADNETKVLPRSSIRTYKDIPYETITEEGVERKEPAGFCVAIADTADEGIDNFAMPILRVVGNQVYLIDCIFDQSNLTIQETAVIIKVKEHKIRKLVVETNSFGAYFRRRLGELLYHDSVEIFGQWSKANKMSRIQNMAGIIKLYFLFPENPNPITQKFMNQVYKLKKTSKKEDDAPDALAGIAAHLDAHYNIFR